MTANSFSMASDCSAQTLHVHFEADAVFNKSRQRAFFGRIQGLVIGKRAMPSLEARLAGKTVAGQHSRGLCSIALEDIVGTESRAGDFDRQFNPLSNRNRERWVSIAALCLSDIGLPAVELIQVGEDYFVRDGHHRVSVARALGWAFLDARVTTLELK